MTRLRQDARWELLVSSHNIAMLTGVPSARASAPHYLLAWSTHAAAS